MDPENEVVIPADQTASEQETTAVTPAPEVTPEKPESESKETPKTFTQEELDDAIGKRLARERRKWERESQRTEQPKPTGDVPKLDQFGTPEEYAEALAQRKAEEILARKEAERTAAEHNESFYEKEEEARAKYEDFERVAYNPRLRITEAMAEVIRASDVGPDVLYFLGSNPKEADRIARLSPFLQAKEIGRLETKVSAEPPPTKQVSKAPAPITPVTSRASTAPVLDTTDPRSVKSMSTSEWIEAERKRQVKKWESQNRR